MVFAWGFAVDEMECPFCKKKVEITQRIIGRKLCKKCWNGVKKGIVVGSIMFDQALKDRADGKVTFKNIKKKKLIKIENGEINE